MEEARRQNRDLHREKFSALSQAKENVEWEKQRQIEQIKEKLEKVSSCADRKILRAKEISTSIVLLLFLAIIGIIIGTFENKVLH